MKLCWDNIEDIILTKKGNFRDIIRKRTYYLKICKKCKEEFLCLSKNNNFCTVSCEKKGKKLSESHKKKISDSMQGENHPWFGRHHSEETKEKLREINLGKKMSNESKKKLSNSIKGRKLSEKARKNIGNAKIGSKNPNWKGGYKKKNIPFYNTYAPQLEWCEKIRRNIDDLNVLEVKCFKCDKWFIPTLTQIRNRVQYLKGNQNYTESSFYCSDGCKHSCSIYGKSPETLMKQDAIRAGRLPWIELTREIQPELRQIVLERDEHKCVKCGKMENLQCHHIFPVNIEPLLSADVDNCITLCYNCHKEVHTKDGCRYGQLRIKEC